MNSIGMNEVFFGTRFKVLKKLYTEISIDIVLLK